MQFNLAITKVAYSTGETTTDVAGRLEDKYKLFSTFLNTSALQTVEDNLFSEIKEKLQGKSMAPIGVLTASKVDSAWIEYIQQEQHGIKTKAAKDNGRTSFVETTALFRSYTTQVKE